MTSILVKIFIKDYNNIEKTSVRTSYGILASFVGVGCNVLLFGIKMILGLWIHSISVMADAFNNLSDAASSIIALVGVKLAERPADKEHPFGHGRWEYIAAFVVSFLIIQVGFSCFKSAISKIIHPERVNFSWIVVGILCMTVFVKLWLSIFNKKLGELIHSNVMKATAADAIGDVIVTLATIASIIMGKLTNLAVDGWMGLIVSIFVLVAGIRIAKETLEPLLGEAVDVEVYHKITKKVESYPGIRGSHDLIVHNYGPSHTMATIHAEVPNNVNLEEIHEIIDQIERDILREMNIFLVIHMDPVEINNVAIRDQKEMILAIIYELEPRANIHDFRLVNGEDQINLIFDLVVPHSYSATQEQELLACLNDKLLQKDARYQTLITIENSFISD